MTIFYLPCSFVEKYHGNNDINRRGNPQLSQLVNLVLGDVFIMMVKMLEYQNIKKNMYSISENGEITNVITGKKLRSNPNSSGYLVLELQTYPSGSKTFSVHRLVAHMFVDRTDTRYNVVNHIDGNKLNNYYTNLEWTDYAGNNEHARKTGLWDKSRYTPFKVYSDELAHEVCQLFEDGHSATAIMEKYDKKGDKKFLAFVYRMLYRKERTNISDQYTFKPTTNWKKWYHHEEENIMELIKDGYKSIEIYRKYGYKKIKENEQFYTFIKDTRRKLKSSTTIENPRKLIIRINLPE